MVGAEVCRLANAFGMKIVVCNLNAKLELMEKYQVEYKSLEELAEIADIISVNVEYTSENYHLCDEEFFAKCKQGVYFINTSKSEVIDYEALYKYIENCKIGGAALDVIPCKDI